MPEQYPIPLRLPDRYTRERFEPAACNREALALVDRFPRTGEYAAVIVGPPASGKTHLAQLWAARVDATAFGTPGATRDPCAPLIGPVVVDDAHTHAPHTLFHLLNTAKASAQSVLLTCSTPPAYWSTLPDLTSRLSSVETVILALPDETMIAEVLQKYFADQQVEVAADVAQFLSLRIERSFESARNYAESLNLLALSRKCAVTIPLARKLFNEEVSTPR